MRLLPGIPFPPAFLLFSSYYVMHLKLIILSCIAVIFHEDGQTMYKVKNCLQLSQEQCKSKALLLTGEETDAVSFPCKSKCYTL